jgi:hypothetical protein
MTLYDVALGPLAEFGFMRRAMVGCLALVLGCGPIGTILMIRRMSLMGDRCRMPCCRVPHSALSSPGCHCRR